MNLSSSERQPKSSQGDGTFKRAAAVRVIVAATIGGHTDINALPVPILQTPQNFRRVDLDLAIQKVGNTMADHREAEPPAVQLTGVYHNLLRPWTEM